MEYLRASSAMPLVTKIVKIGDKKYLDGAVTDSVPINRFLGEYDKIIVVLTQPSYYRKKSLSEKQLKLIQKRYKKYPLLIKRMINRPNEYNEMIDKIDLLAKEEKIFLIRPSTKLDIDISNKNKDDIERVYNVGVNDCQEKLDALKCYLKKGK